MRAQIQFFGQSLQDHDVRRRARSGMARGGTVRCGADDEACTARRESIEVRESTRVVLGSIPKKGRCGVLLTLVSCRPRSLRDLPP